jgi:hypothetical protein
MTPLRKSRISRIQKVPPDSTGRKANSYAKFSAAFDCPLEYVRKKNNKKK